VHTLKNGLVRKRSQSSSVSDSQSALGRGAAPSKSAASLAATGSTLTTSLLHKGGSLAIALQASRRSSSSTTRTSFVRSTTTGSGSTEASSSFQKCIAFNHVVFHTSTNSNSRSQMSAKHSKGAATSRLGAAPSRPLSVSAGTARITNKRSASLFSHLAVAGFQKKPRTR
jgi:hypothetical protein